MDNQFILPLDPTSQFVKDLKDPLVLGGVKAQLPYIYGYRNIPENCQFDVDHRQATFVVLDIQPLGPKPFITVHVFRDGIPYVQHSLNQGHKVRANLIRTGKVLRMINHFLF